MSDKLVSMWKEAFVD